MRNAARLPLALSATARASSPRTKLVLPLLEHYLAPERHTGPVRRRREALHRTAASGAVRALSAPDRDTQSLTELAFVLSGHYCALWGCRGRTRGCDGTHCRTPASRRFRALPRHLAPFRARFRTPGPLLRVPPARRRRAYRQTPPTLLAPAPSQTPRRVQTTASKTWLRVLGTASVQPRRLRRAQAVHTHRPHSVSTSFQSAKTGPGSAAADAWPSDSDSSSSNSPAHSFASPSSADAGMRGPLEGADTHRSASLPRRVRPRASGACGEESTSGYASHRTLSKPFAAAPGERASRPTSVGGLRRDHRRSAAHIATPFNAFRVGARRTILCGSRWKIRTSSRRVARHIP